MARFLNVRIGVAGTLCLIGFAASGSVSVGTIVQEDKRTPQPWRTLSSSEQAQFDLGHATFNTQWSVAQKTASRTDGLGPAFNVPSCDACHNSRRRGRGPLDAGDAPGDLVIQLGRIGTDGEIERGTVEYGRVLNTGATHGIQPEGSVLIRYTESTRTLADGSTVRLRTPEYELRLSGPDVANSTVVMPRMAPSLFGVGLLERVPESALRSLELAAKRTDQSARLSRLKGTAEVGRFGWQATEATVASQTASAFGREMGLTTSLVSEDDCGADAACRRASNGGIPEVDSALFEALVAFQTLHAVPVTNREPQQLPAAALFDRAGCAECHAPSLPIDPAVHSSGVIRPFTDLLLHDLGEGLADRDLAGRVIRSEWRTAPLWGMNAAVTSGQPLRLLHDGRARSIEEAILWHGGAATSARERYERADAAQRRALVAWIEQL